MEACVHVCLFCRLTLFTVNLVVDSVIFSISADQYMKLRTMRWKLHQDKLSQVFAHEQVIFVPLLG